MDSDVPGAFLQACGYSDLFLPARPCCTACGLLETAKEKARVHQDNAPPSLPLGESNLCSRVGYVSTSFISSAADIVPSVSRWWFLVDSSFAISLRGKSPRQNPQLWVWDSNATGRRPSLTSSGCWWSISFTHASRSPPPPPTKRERNNGEYIHCILSTTSLNRIAISALSLLGSTVQLF